MSKQMTIGISISECEDMGKYGLSHMHLQDSLVETARFLLNKNYHLAYGGDLNYSGPFNFTELLFQLMMTYGNSGQKVVNYSVFPLYLKISKKREADISRVAKIIRVNPDKNFDSWNLKRYEELSSDDRTYIDTIFKSEDDLSKNLWAQALTRMRKQMARDVQCRIVIGGKLKGYKGKYPGVIEETLLSIENKVTVFLDGRMGGAALEIVNAIKNNTPGQDSGIAFPEIKKTLLKDLGDKRMVIQGEYSFPEIERYFRIF
jgi:hypothetical protein